MLLLRRHLLPLLRAASPLPSPIHHRACLLLSTTASAAAPTAPFSLEDYLVATCGLAPAQARKTAQKAFDEASKDCRRNAFEEVSHSRLNSASNPDAILALLSDLGLARADIAAVVTADPLILRSSAKTLGPRLLPLRDRLGLSSPQIFRLFVIGSRVLRRGDVVPKLEFFVSLFGSFEKLLVSKSCIWVLTADLERSVKPNIELLRQCGLSVRDIAQLCSRKGWLLSYDPERFKEFVLRTEELGVPPSSRMFGQALLIIASFTKEKIAAKFEFLKSTLGCSESKIATAVCRLPPILGLSEEYLLRKIQFLVNEVGLEPQYIVQRPVLLGLSLENRLMPRHCVMKVLQAKGLLSSNKSFLSFVSYGDEAFRLKFIDCHKDSVPGLAGYCATSSARDVDPKVQLSS